MRALTFHQPWAQAIALGYKRIETRSWRPTETFYRAEMRPFAIHAGATTDFEFARWVVGERLPGLAWSRLPVKSIVAVADVRCVLPALEALEQFFSASRPAGIYWREKAFGDYSEGRWGWVLDSIRRLAEPVPCPGKQGLWIVPEDVEAQVIGQARAGEDVPV